MEALTDHSLVSKCYEILRDFLFANSDMVRISSDELTIPVDRSKLEKDYAEAGHTGPLPNVVNTFIEKLNSLNSDLVRKAEEIHDMPIVVNGEYSTEKMLFHVYDYRLSNGVKDFLLMGHVLRGWIDNFQLIAPEFYKGQELIGFYAHSENYVYLWLSEHQKKEFEKFGFIFDKTEWVNCEKVYKK